MRMRRIKIKYRNTQRNRLWVYNAKIVKLRMQVLLILSLLPLKMLL